MTANRENIEKPLIETLADRSGLAVVLADGKNKPVEGANNNSMCRVLYSSDEFAPQCEAFCGRAFERASEAGKPVAYQCHAGLSCLAVPLKRDEKQLVAIVGRTFFSAENYRRATERAAAGDWQIFDSTDFFANILFGGSPQSLAKLAERLEKLSDEKKNELFQFAAARISRDEATKARASKNAEDKARPEASDAIAPNDDFAPDAATDDETGSSAVARRVKRDNVEEIAAWRSLFGSLLSLDYRQACVSILEFLQKRYALNSLVWLERRGDRLQTILAVGGRLPDFQIGVSLQDERLIDAARRAAWLELAAQKSNESAESDDAAPLIQLFPLAVGSEIRSALAIGDRIEDENKKRRLASFCRAISFDLEILRLRGELSRRAALAQAVEKFNDNLKKIDSEDFWLGLTQISAEVLRAERASLLFFDDDSASLQAKAVIGAVNDLSGENIGARIAQSVLQNGHPLVVADMAHSGIASSPPEWQYKTDSFISYPIFIGARKIAVINFTDRADRSNFGFHDLELLHSITPQIAVAIDRAALKDKAGKFEQLSVTDPLTGLLNRRYLKERLTEEIKRSNRHGFPMSFMMIDVDYFKSYNDTFGHGAGDEALRMVGTLLKETLRGADVAVRYGGEEFSVLLPQTTLEESAAIAERIRANIEAAAFPHRKVTVSIGAASCTPDLTSPNALISAADKALYQAKRSGRNTVQFYENLDCGE